MKINKVITFNDYAQYEKAKVGDTNDNRLLAGAVHLVNRGLAETTSPVAFDDDTPMNDLDDLFMIADYMENLADADSDAARHQFSMMGVNRDDIMITLPNFWLKRHNDTLDRAVASVDIERMPYGSLNGIWAYCVGCFALMDMEKSPVKVEGVKFTRSDNMPFVLVWLFYTEIAEKAKKKYLRR